MSLREQAIRPAYQQDSIREHLLPILTASVDKQAIFQHLIHHHQQQKYNPHLHVEGDPNAENEYHWDPEAKAVVRKKKPGPKPKPQNLWEKAKGLFHKHA